MKLFSRVVIILVSNTIQLCYDNYFKCLLEWIYVEVAKSTDILMNESIFVKSIKKFTGHKNLQRLFFFCCCLDVLYGSLFIYM